LTHIGIDLGTTNSLISVFTDDGPQLINNSLGSPLTPSVVSLDNDGTLLCGEMAQTRLVSAPKQTANLFKRSMGANKTYRLGKKKFSAEELSAVILRSLKADAEAHLGHEVVDVVISVPAYFNELQRKAVKAAGKMAGLNPLRLINEPTAAALTYGLQDLEAESTILVYDLGGGTFDVSILEVFEGVMEVKSTAGDAYLGGEDFTAKLTEHLAEKLPGAAGKADAGALRKLAEQAKLGLSEKHSVDLSASIGGSDVKISITRDEFEALTASLLTRLRRPVERCLYDANLSVDKIDKVVLVGGATRMPVIRTLVAKQLRKLPESRINPDHVVALGAAVQAGLVGSNKALDDVVMTDVTAFTLGIETAQQVGRETKAGYYLPIIERNTVVPVSRETIVNTIHLGQEHVTVNVFQGEAPVVKSNIFLGELSVRVPRNMKDYEAISIRLTYDVSGLLDVDVTILSTGITKSLTITALAGEISAAKIEKTRKSLAALKIHPRDLDENKHLMGRLEQCYAMARLGDRDEIQQMMLQFEATIERQNQSDIERLRQEIITVLDQFEAGYVN